MHPRGGRVGAAGESPLFEDVFLGGFECSCQRLEDGQRVDMLAGTGHREHVEADHARLRSVGMTACCDGVSWVYAARPGNGFDFAAATPMIRPADRQSVTWDPMLAARSHVEPSLLVTATTG